MKKFVLSLLAVLCIASLISCGEDPQVEDPDTPPVEAPIVEPDKPDEPEEVDNTLALATLDKARQAALDIGAETKAADQLKAIDALYDSIKAKAETKVDVSKDSQDVTNRYLALAAYINAKETKEKVDQTEKASIAQQLYDQGCTALDEADALFANPEATGKQILEKATKASANFNAVLLAISKKAARDQKTSALDSKKNAESVKAQVSMKDKYNEAVALVRKGDQLYATQDPLKALDNYKAAGEIFEQLYVEVSEKRAAALKAIEEAKKAVEESSNVAASADAEKPITAPVEGIEEEGTVLLEEDTYEDPAASTVELSEDVEDPLRDAIEQIKEDVKESVYQGEK